MVMSTLFIQDKDHTVHVYSTYSTYTTYNETWYTSYFDWKNYEMI